MDGTGEEIRPVLLERFVERRLAYLQPGCDFAHR